MGPSEVEGFRIVDLGIHDKRQPRQDGFGTQNFVTLELSFLTKLARITVILEHTLKSGHVSRRDGYPRMSISTIYASQLPYFADFIVARNGTQNSSCSGELVQQQYNLPFGGGNKRRPISLGKTF